MFSTRLLSNLKTIKTFGNSMFPVLLDGDVVYLKKKKFENLTVNDVVCVRKKSRIFTHRIIFKDKKYVITRGDNNILSDGKIYSKNIIGLVYKVKRGPNILGINDIYLIQSALYFKEILKVKKAISKENIKPVFLKGLPLHLYYQGSHPKRLYADVDILIAPKYLKNIKRIFRLLKYDFIDPKNADIHKTGLRWKVTEVGFIKRINGFPIVWDVHFEIKFTMSHLRRISALYDQDLVNSLTDKFIQEKRELKLHDEGFYILSKENLLVYLMLHLFRHNFKEVHRLEFIKGILKKEKIDLNSVSVTILKYHLKNFIYPCLLFLKKYYDVSFPNTFMECVKPDSKIVKFIKENIHAVNIFEREDRVEAGVNRFKNLFYLSPIPPSRKILVFLDPEVLRMATRFPYKRLLFSKMLRFK